MSQAGLALLILGLKTISQRFLIALAALRGLLMASSVFALAFVVEGDPSTYKLIGLAIYALFVLAFEFWTWRRE